MSLTLQTSRNSVRAGRTLGTGRQGAVLALERPHDNLVFKKFKPDVLIADSQLEARILMMVRNRPAGLQDTGGHSNLAWPVDVVRENGRFTGYVMPRIELKTAVHIHDVANPTGQAGALNWKERVSVARNLAVAVAQVHGSGVVIGDFNESNALVSRDTRVTLVDCDSMQIKDPVTGKLFLCPVGRPEFTAPELLGADWRATTRHTSSDLFALAIHMHQLLLIGEHPFRGVWDGAGEKPPSQTLARQGLWTFGGNAALSPRPTAIGIQVLPVEIRGLFHRAFVVGATNPRNRPSAEEWKRELSKLQAELRQCRKDKDHYFRTGQTTCPWCAQEASRAERAASAARAQARQFSATAPGFVNQPTAAVPPTNPGWTRSYQPVTPPPSTSALSYRLKEMRHRDKVVGCWLAAALITVAAPYFLGTFIDPTLATVKQTYKGVSVADLAGIWGYLPALLLGAAALVGCYAIFVARPVRWKSTWVKDGQRRLIAAGVIAAIAFGLAVASGVTASKGKEIASWNYAHNAISSSATAPDCGKTWTWKEGDREMTAQPEYGGKEQCRRIQQYVAWKKGWNFTAPPNSEVNGLTGYRGILITQIAPNRAPNYVVGLDRATGGVAWKFRCPGGADQSEPDYRNADSTKSRDNSFAGVAQYLVAECDNTDFYVAASNGRVLGRRRA